MKNYEKTFQEKLVDSQKLDQLVIYLNIIYFISLISILFYSMLKFSLNLFCFV